jgi:raffinose/stachyose/melibiose transport system substrate-binding protein
MSRTTGRHRILLVLALVLMTPLAMAIAHAAPTAAQDQVKISFWLDNTGGGPTADCIVKTAIDPFNAKGGTQVEATLQANNWDATRTALAGGAGPDVVTTPGPSFALELAKAGQLVALDDVANQQGWATSFVPWALDLGKVDGKLYSIPNEVETLVLYYNKTLFQEKGWETPKTLDDLMALAATIKADGEIPFAHANQEWRPANEWFVGEMLNHGAGPQKVYDALTGKAKWTDPAFEDAITKLNEMQQNGWFMGGLDRYYTTTFNDANVSFGDGDAAMKIEGTWWIADGQNFFGGDSGNDNEWDWVPVPSTSGDAIFDLGIGSTYSINANSKHQAETAEFLTYYFSPENQAALTTKCSLAPAPVTIPPDLLSGLDPRYAAILQALTKASTENNYGYTTWTFWPTKTETDLIDNVEKVWAGDMTADEYLQGLQTQFDQELQSGAIPPLPSR